MTDLLLLRFQDESGADGHAHQVYRVADTAGFGAQRAVLQHPRQPGHEHHQTEARHVLGRLKVPLQRWLRLDQRMLSPAICIGQYSFIFFLSFVFGN